MKKTRLLRLIAALLMTVSVMGAPAMQAEAAGCSNWQIYSTGTPFCRQHDRCGFLWLKSETHYQYKYYKKTCVSNTGEVTTEYKSSMEKLGCC